MFYTPSTYIIILIASFLVYFVYFYKVSGNAHMQVMPLLLEILGTIQLVACSHGYLAKFPDDSH